MKDYTYHPAYAGDRFTRGRDWGTFPQTTSFLKRLVAAYKKWRERAVAIRELERLSDYLLADIGIPRAQIREVVEGLVGRNDHPRKDTGTTTAEVSATACCATS